MAAISDWIGGGISDVPEPLPPPEPPVPVPDPDPEPEPEVGVATGTVEMTVVGTGCPPAGGVTVCTRVVSVEGAGGWKGIEALEGL